MRYLLTFLLSFITQLFFAQHQGAWVIESSIRGGTLIAHRPVMNHLPKEHIVAGNFAVGRIVNGSKRWHKELNYPLIGGMYYQGNLGNKELLGDSKGTCVFIAIPFQQALNWQTNVQLGSGLAYLSNPFDLYRNPKNVAVASYWNCMIQLSFNTIYKFRKAFIGTGIDLIHFSNAAMKAPNLGLNIPQIKLTIGSILSENQKSIKLTRKDSLTNFQKRNSYHLLAYASQKALSNHPTENYNVYGATLLFQRQVKQIHGYEIGADFIYNTSDKQVLEDRYILTSNYWKAGILGGYVMFLDRFQLCLGMGLYVRDRFNLNGLFYHRTGIRYTLWNHLDLNLTLKSHWANADYAEFGLGFKF
jgi:hypothetical protein